MLLHKYIKNNGAVEIARTIEHAADEGLLAAGAKLPTVRELAKAKGISPTTIAAAYRMLRERGVVVARGRAGTFLRTSEVLAPRVAAALPTDVRDLRNGNPDPRLLPNLSRALAAVPHTSRLYEEQLEEPELLALAQADFANDGIAADNLAVTSGALDAIDRVLAAHLRPGDRVLVEDPSFPNVIDLVAALGLVAVPVAIDESSFEVEALTAALTAGARAIIITPRAQNPTGAALDEQRARVLRRVLRTAPDLLIIEDDHAARVAGVKACTLVEKNRRNWAVIRSVAKALGPDLRVAVTAGDAQTISRVRSRQRAGMRWVSGILQKMVVSLWTDPTVVRGLVRAEKTYALRRKALIDALAEHGIQASGRSGMNVWIPVREEAEPIAALQARGWAVAAGERFRIRTGPGLRVTVATLEVAEAPHLAKDIAAVV